MSLGTTNNSNIFENCNNFMYWKSYQFACELKYLNFIDIVEHKKLRTRNTIFIYA